MSEYKKRILKWRKNPGNRGNPLKRVIFHFTQMSTFSSLKRPFFAQMSCQSAQMSRAGADTVFILLKF